MHFARVHDVRTVCICVLKLYTSICTDNSNNTYRFKGKNFGQCFLVTKTVLESGQLELDVYMQPTRNDFIRQLAISLIAR